MMDNWQPIIIPLSMKKLIAAVALPVILSGCAVSNNAKKFGDAPRPTVRADKAVLYFFREYAEPTAFSAEVQIDDRPVASLAQQGFSWVYVTPGKHLLTQKWTFMAGMPSLNFEQEFEANKTYAFEIKGRSTFNGIAAGMMQFTASTVVATVEPESAERLMEKCCRYVEAIKE